MHVENITSNAMSLDRNGQSMLIQVYEKEINRLNNIINELEEFLNKVVETGASIEQITCKNILNYLQELKENKC